MPKEIELEKTYLLKYLPVDIKEKQSIEILDIYIPKSADHSILRIRKRGEICEITKKQPIHGSDSSEQEEHTINLSKEEFLALANVDGKKLHKLRYIYPCGEDTAEIDVYQDDFKGLVFVDFEFKTSEAKDKFLMPEFCLAEITQEKFCASGWLAGKKYSDIEQFLGAYGYKKIND
jgi:CYTH domain-containing protein